MDRLITKKLEVAARVQEFQRAHPYSDRNQAAVAARLEERLAQAQALFLKEHAERMAANDATQKRQDVRRALEVQSMRSVAQIGAIAVRDDTVAAKRFTAPAQNEGHAAFLARATALLDLASAHREALSDHGLARGQLSEFTTNLRGYEAATAEAQASRRRHRETQAALRRATADLANLVKLLDVFNRRRLAGDADALRMWTNLRTVGRAVASRSKRGAVPGPVPVPVPGPVPGTAPAAGPTNPPSTAPTPPPETPPSSPVTATPRTPEQSESSTSAHAVPTSVGNGNDEPPLPGGLNQAA